MSWAYGPSVPRSSSASTPASAAAAASASSFAAPSTSASASSSSSASASASASALSLVAANLHTHAPAAAAARLSAPVSSSGAGGGGSYGRAHYYPIVENDTSVATRLQRSVVGSGGVSGVGGGGGDQCPICLDAWTNAGPHQVVCLRCGHLFGHACVVKWLRTRSVCPTCQVKARRQDVRLLYVPNTLAVHDAADVQRIRDELADERARAALVRAELAKARLECTALRNELMRVKTSRSRSGTSKRVVFMGDTLDGDATAESPTGGPTAPPFALPAATPAGVTVAVGVGDGASGPVPQAQAPRPTTHSQLTPAAPPSALPSRPAQVRAAAAGASGPAAPVAASSPKIGPSLSRLAEALEAEERAASQNARERPSSPAAALASAVDSVVEGMRDDDDDDDERDGGADDDVDYDRDDAPSTHRSAASAPPLSGHAETARRALLARNSRSSNGSTSSLNVSALDEDDDAGVESASEHASGRGDTTAASALPSDLERLANAPVPVPVRVRPRSHSSSSAQQHFFVDPASAFADDDTMQQRNQALMQTDSSVSADTSIDIGAVIDQAAAVAARSPVRRGRPSPVRIPSPAADRAPSSARSAPLAAASVALPPAGSVLVVGRNGALLVSPSSSGPPSAMPVSSAAAAAATAAAAVAPIGARAPTGAGGSTAFPPSDSGSYAAIQLQRRLSQGSGSARRRSTSGSPQPAARAVSPATQFRASPARGVSPHSASASRSSTPSASASPAAATASAAAGASSLSLSPMRARRLLHAGTTLGDAGAYTMTSFGDDGLPPPADFAPSAASMAGGSRPRSASGPVWASVSGVPVSTAIHTLAASAAAAGAMTSTLTARHRASVVGDATAALMLDWQLAHTPLALQRARSLALGRAVAYVGAQTAPDVHRVLRVSTIDPRHTIRCAATHSKPIRSIRVHESRDMVAAVSHDRGVSICSGTTGAALLRFEAGEPVWSCAWDVDASEHTLVCGLSSGQLAIYDLRRTSTYVMLAPGADSTPVFELTTVPGMAGGLLSASSRGVTAWLRDSAYSASAVTQLRGFCTSVDYDALSGRLLSAFRPSMGSSDIPCSWVSRVRFDAAHGVLCEPGLQLTGHTNSSLMCNAALVRDPRGGAAVPSELFAATGDEDSRRLVVWRVTAGRSDPFHVLPQQHTTPIVSVAARDTRIAVLSEQQLMLYEYHGSV